MEPPSEIENSVKHHVHKVIIIGAGISGLSAARHFMKNGISDILILEATHKAGGRIDTIPFGNEKNGLVELGAQWIHGEQNEFCQLVKSSDHRHVKTSWEGKGDFLCPNGVKIENDLVDEVLGWIEDTIEQVEATFTIESLQQRQPEVVHNSMGQYLRDSFVSYLRDNHPESEDGSPEYNLRMALFQWGMSFQRIDNSCNKMNDVSLYRWAEFEVNPGEHYNNFARGAQSFVDEILIGTAGGKVDNLRFKVVYNSPVENISWKHENGQDLGQVRLTTTNGNVYEAECVLVTCSVGVLKSKVESLFTPKLPDNLSKAIKCTGFGPVTKIFLEWSQPWWPSDLKGFQLVWPEEFIDCCDSNSESNEPLNTHGSLDDTWHKTITGFDPVLDNPNVLLAWLGGYEAVHAESLSQKEISEKCVQVLKNFTGFDVPPPQSVAVSKWSTNEFFQGAYSFRAVDSDEIAGDICAILCEPIIVKDANDINKPVIVLAGEALSKSHYSTLHGAFESGISQASKIIQYFQALSSVSSSSNPSPNKTSCAPCKSTAKTCRLTSSNENTQSFKSGTGEKFTFSNKEVIQVPS